MIDLTHPIETGMQTFPDDPPVEVTQAASVNDDGYGVEAVELGSHTGTHVDAPAHVFADGQTIDEYDVDRFVFDAVRVDCRDYTSRDAVGPEQIPRVDCDCVILHTGWDRHWGTDEYLDHPYLSPEAARVCRDRGFAVASDTLNPDPTPTPAATTDEPDGFPVHDILLGDDLLIVENLTNLAATPRRLTLLASPLALTGDGAPVRAVGVTENDPIHSTVDHTTDEP
ncbi:cyclase family protein [Halobaculum sp. MBLA0147]|uniref:cyclase family protein n=1 Tax=Halobaculum sp. MBLA0147 TaxID=3079934 RepID=UPI003525D5D7